MQKNLPNYIEKSRGTQRFVLRLSAFLQNLFVVRAGEYLLHRRLKGVRDLVGGHILERRGNRVWIPAGAGCQNLKAAMESRGSVAGMLAATVFAASMAIKMASTDSIKSFRFIAFTPLRLYLQ